MPGIAFELLRTEAQLLGIEPEWRLLFEAMGQPSPFIDFDWVLMGWRHVAAAGRSVPVVAIIRDGGRLVVALPLTRHPYRRLLHRYSGMQSAMPDYDDALVAPGGDRAAWARALEQGLRRDRLSIGVKLISVPQASPLRDLLAPYVVGGPGGAHPVVELDQGFAAYLARFSAPTRQTDRRLQRHLVPGGNVELRLATMATADADLDWLFVQKRAWQPPNGRLREWVSAPGYERDVRDLVRKWLPAGRLQLCFIAAADGRRAAGAMLFLSGRIGIYYLVTYDPQFAGVSPGRMLSLKIIEWMSAQGYALLDFMGGRWEWKERLKTRTHYMRSYEIGAPGWYLAIRRLVRRGGWSRSRRPE